MKELLKYSLSIFVLLAASLTTQAQTPWATATASNQIKILNAIKSNSAITVNSATISGDVYSADNIVGSGTKNLADIYYKNTVYDYTLSCVSTNTGTAYTGAYYIIGNNTLTPASMYSMSIPNGTYEMYHTVHYWLNSVNHCGDLYLQAFTSTLTGVNDNAIPVSITFREYEKLAFTVSYTGYTIGSGRIISQGYINTRPNQITNNTNQTACFKVTNGVLWFLLWNTSACTPGINADYGFKFQLKKL